MSVKSPSPPVKEQLREIADQLADDATWNDAVHKVSVRRELEAAVEEADEGQLIPQAVVFWFGPQGPLASVAHLRGDAARATRTFSASRRGVRAATHRFDALDIKQQSIMMF